MKPSATTKGFFFQSGGNASNNGSNNKDDNNSPSPLSNYWSSSIGSTIKWKRACIDESLNYYITNSRLLLKIIAACISIALIGFIVTSLLRPDAHHRHQLLIGRGINKTVKYDSTDIDSEVTTDAASTTLHYTASSISQINNNLPLNSLPSSSSNVITTQNELQQKSNDDHSKNYVRPKAKRFSKLRSFVRGSIVNWVSLPFRVKNI